MSESADQSGLSRYFKIGLFMLTGLSIFVGSLIALGAGSLFRKTIPAETLVYESVSGLEVGAAVKYRGVPIGHVTKIIFAGEKYKEADLNNSHFAGDRASGGILIEMSLDVGAFPGKDQKQIISSSKQTIENGLRARVTPAGISGQSYIDCDLLNPADNPPPAISWTPNELYIPSAPSTVGQVMDAAGDIATQLRKADLGKIAKHIDELATQATATISDVRQAVAANRGKLDRVMTELPDTAARLRETVARADEILHDPRVNKAIDGVNGVEDSATATLADIRRVAHEATELIEDDKGDLRDILSDLRRVSADAAVLVDDIKANPSRLLFGKPPSQDTPGGVAPVPR